MANNGSDKEIDTARKSNDDRVSLEEDADTAPVGDRDKEVEIARKIFESYASLRADQILADIVVVVENKEFPCHSTVLAAASDYFKTALTTELRECRERRITLNDVTERVFSTLLTCIYEGKYVLTEENVFEVWRAADMLRITFIIAQCVDLCKVILETKMSPQNCVDYLCKVRLLDHQAKLRVLEFICKNFTACSIQLNAALFTRDEIKSLLIQNNLSVWSEDLVIEFVLKWAEDNQESLHPTSLGDDLTKHSGTLSPEIATTPPVNTLAEILDCTRYLLISRGCLRGTLATHPLVVAEPHCQVLVEQIAWYQAQPHLLQTWCPPAAIQRRHSETTNVLLLCQVTSNGLLKILDLEKMAWRDIAASEELNGLKAGERFMYYDFGLYFVSGDRISMYSLMMKKLLHIQHSPNDGVLSVVNESIFLYTRDGAQDTCVKRERLLHFPSSVSNTDNCQFNPLFTIGCGEIDGMAIKGVSSIGSTEIVFLVSDDVNYYTVLSTSEASTLYYNISDKIESSSRLVTARHDKNVFVLQENGHLWKIQLIDRLARVQITHKLVLWDGEVSLNGAVFYDDQLMIVGDFKDQTEVSVALDRSLPGVFKSVRKIKICSAGVSGSHSVVLAVLPKSILIEQIVSHNQGRGSGKTESHQQGHGAGKTESQHQWRGAGKTESHYQWRGVDHTGSYGQWRGVLNASVANRLKDW